ncbi:MAG: PilZ domain-containing protein [Comamonadaceae bacterium]|nr:PilZ domain-containing protein [Comamonadaceae bacterium]
MGWGLQQIALKAGDVLTLEFPVSEEHIPLPVLASVVWSVRDGDNWRAGLRFALKVL